MYWLKPTILPKASVTFFHTNRKRTAAGECSHKDIQEYLFQDWRRKTFYFHWKVSINNDLQYWKDVDCGMSVDRTLYVACSNAFCSVMVWMIWRLTSRQKMWLPKNSTPYSVVCRYLSSFPHIGRYTSYSNIYVTYVYFTLIAPEPIAMMMNIMPSLYLSITWHH